MSTLSTWLPKMSMYKRSVRFILVWNIIFCLGLSIYQVLYNLYLKELMGEREIGQIVGLGYLSYAIFSLAGGLLSDQIGPKKTLIIGILFLVGGISGGSAAESAYYLYLWSVVTGIGQAFTIAMFVLLLTEHSQSTERIGLFSIAYGSGTFALFAGTMGAGLLTDSFQQVFYLSELWSIRLTMFICALCIFVSVLPLLSVKSASTPQVKMPKSDGYSNVFTSRTYSPVITYGITKLMEGVGVGLIIPFMNLFLVGRFELGTMLVSAVMAIATLGTVVMMFLNPLISKKLGEIRSIVVYQMIGLPCLLLLSFTMNIWLAALCFLIFRTLFYSTMPTQSKIIMESIDESKKGLISSIGLMANTIGIGLASPLSMHLVASYGNYWGYVYAFCLSALWIAASVTYFYWIFARNRRGASAERGQISLQGYEKKA